MQKIETEIDIDINIAHTLDYYGITVMIGSEDVDLSTDCYMVLLKDVSSANMDDDRVADLFNDCHRVAITNMKFGESLTKSEFNKMLSDSVVMASYLMNQYGLNATHFHEVDDSIKMSLFVDSIPDPYAEFDNAPN